MFLSGNKKNILFQNHQKQIQQNRNACILKNPIFKIVGILRVVTALVYSQ